MRPSVLLALASCLLLGACATRGPSPVIRVVHSPAQRGYSEEGLASYHAPSRFSRHSRTASGKKWSNSALIAAHRTLRLGTLVRVRNLKNDQSVVVQITDRGPYVDGRIIDVSPRAADLLGFKGHGLTRVRVEVVD